MDSAWDLPIFVPKNAQQQQQQQLGLQTQQQKQLSANQQALNTARQQQQQSIQPQKQAQQNVTYVRKEPTRLRFFDVAANMGSSQFAGIYKGKRMHENDVKDVIARAEAVGCDRLLLSASNYKDSKECYSISQLNDKFYSTVGLHPSKSREAESDPAKYFAQLDELITKYGTKCVAVGECGLDYDRLFCSPKDVQLEMFQRHFDLAEKHKLPMYLHSRNSREDFLKILKANRKRFTNGLVHSYTGGIPELEELLAEGMYISVNALAFKDKRDWEVIKRIPLDRIMIETDAPYCKIKPADDGFELLTSPQPHFVNNNAFKKGSFVKGRNEPYFVKEVSEMLAAVLKKSEQEIAEICYENSLRFFNIKDDSSVNSDTSNGQKQ